MKRPTEAIFADGTKRRPLAIHPEAIGVAYSTRTAEETSAEITDGIAVLCIDGPLEHKGGDSWWSYWQNYEDLADEFNALCTDSSVRAIILKFDSPGGEVSGLTETVKIMQALKVDSGKPVVGYVDESCYSAAYALAMVCDEIYMPESAGVGSIGVITAMADQTAKNKKDGIRVEVIASGTKKTDGHPCVEITDGAIARTQKMVDSLAVQFFDIVSSARGIPPKTIEGFQAGVFTGQDAVDVGLADGIMSFAECLTLASNTFTPNRTPTNRSAEKEPPMSGQLAAAKALNDANAAMAAAKTDAARALAAARILAAEASVADAKKTKTKTVTTDTHEEEVDDGEPDEDDDADAEKSDDDESPSDKEKAKGEDDKASASHERKLVALARKITGQHSLDEVMGALQGIADANKSTSKLAAKVAELEANARADKLTALISSGLKAGKLAPSQRAWARTQTPASLKAYLDASPKMVHTSDDEHIEAKAGANAGGVTAEMARIWKKQGFAEKDFPKLVEKMNGASGANGAT